MLDATRAELVGVLEGFAAADAAEVADVERVLDLLRTEARPFARTTARGHITASAFVVDYQGQHALLVWHRKLGRWLQPGGHCEPDTDTSVAAAAVRELIEETHLSPAELGTGSPELFDVDIHPIPAFGAEPPHEHFDLRFLFRIRPGVAATPGLLGRWFSLTDAVVQGEASLARMAAKVGAALDRS